MLLKINHLFAIGGYQGHTQQVMRSKLSKSLLSFSYSRSNRIGSDELIALSKSGSGENLLALDHVRVGRLRKELEQKERTISVLKKQLENLTVRDPASKGPNRCLSALSRSASIISGTLWFIIMIDKQLGHGLSDLAVDNPPAQCGLAPPGGQVSKKSLSTSGRNLSERTDMDTCTGKDSI
jgi:hypothetical protein